MTIAPQRVTVLPAPEPEAASWLHPSDEPRAIAEVQARIEDSVRGLVTQWQALSPTDHRPGRLLPEDVLDLMGDFVGSGGKLLRPRMAYWGWVAAGGARWGIGREEMVRAGAALELLHAFALVHDDVMDASEQRRGQPSVHARARDEHHRAGALGDAGRYGESMAILVGDLLHSEADGLAACLPAPMRAAWRTLSIELIAGQARDLVGAASGRRDLEHARQVAAMKSGAYTAWRPLQLGALAAGAGTETLAALHEFGLHLGEAFALRDDILGVVGDPTRTGKPAGDDIVAGKPTVLLALAEQRFPATWRLALRRAGTSQCTAAQAEAIAEALGKYGVLDDVEAMIVRAVDAGSAALDSPAVDPAAAAGLRALAHRIAWRDS